MRYDLRNKNERAAFAALVMSDSIVVDVTVITPCHISKNTRRSFFFEAVDMYSGVVTMNGVSAFQTFLFTTEFARDTWLNCQNARVSKAAQLIFRGWDDSILNAKIQSGHARIIP